MKLLQLNISSILLILGVAFLPKNTMAQTLYLADAPGTRGPTTEIIQSIQENFPEGEKALRLKRVHWRSNQFRIPPKVDQRLSFTKLVKEAKRAGRFKLCVYKPNNEPFRRKVPFALDAEGRKVIMSYVPYKLDVPSILDPQTLKQIDENHPLLYVVQRKLSQAEMNERNRRWKWIYPYSCPSTWDEAMTFLEHQKNNQHYDDVLATNKIKAAEDKKTAEQAKLESQKQAVGFIDGEIPEWFVTFQNLLGIELDPNLTQTKVKARGLDEKYNPSSVVNGFRILRVLPDSSLYRHLGANLRAGDTIPLKEVGMKDPYGTLYAIAQRVNSAKNGNRVWVPIARTSSPGTYAREGIFNIRVAVTEKNIDQKNDPQIKAQIAAVGKPFYTYARDLNEQLEHTNISLLYEVFLSNNIPSKYRLRTVKRKNSIVTIYPEDFLFIAVQSYSKAVQEAGCEAVVPNGMVGYEFEKRIVGKNVYGNSVSDNTYRVAGTVPKDFYNIYQQHDKSASALQLKSSRHMANTQGFDEVLVKVFKHNKCDSSIIRAAHNRLKRVRVTH